MRLACRPAKCVLWFKLNEPIMTAQTIVATRSNRAEFTHLQQASDYRDRCNNSGKYAIILGDNMKYWILTNREASVLVKAGFELAN